VVIVGASGGRISIVKVSVSVALVSSLTWTVKVKVPAVLGTPKISPVLPANSNSLVPGGSWPSTTLNDGSLLEDAQPVTVMKKATSVPTWPVIGPTWGSIVHGAVWADADGAPSTRSGRTSSTSSNFRMRASWGWARCLLGPTTSTTGDG
jgi:hypothetical protein